MSPSSPFVCLALMTSSKVTLVNGLQLLVGGLIMTPSVAMHSRRATRQKNQARTIRLSFSLSHSSVLFTLLMVSNDREPVVNYAKPAAGGVGGPSRMRRGVLPHIVSCDYFFIR